MTAGRRMARGARSEGPTLRLLGGLAVREHCRSVELCERDHSDLDMVAPARQARRLAALFARFGYAEDVEVSMATARSDPRRERGAAIARSLHSAYRRGMGMFATDIEKLAPEERLRLIGDLWDSLRARPGTAPLTRPRRNAPDRHHTEGHGLTVVAPMRAARDQGRYGRRLRGCPEAGRRRLWPAAAALLGVEEVDVLGGQLAGGDDAQ